MPNKKSAEKRMRQNEKRAVRNKAVKNAMKTTIKSTLKIIEAKDVEGLKAKLNNAISVINKTAQKGVIHKRSAARKQSRLQKKANALLNQGQKTK